VDGAPHGHEVAEYVHVFAVLAGCGLDLFGFAKALALPLEATSDDPAQHARQLGSQFLGQGPILLRFRDGHVEWHEA